MGLIDLHLHLLPAVDDGCKTMDDTLAMARALVSLGYSQVAPSPHNRPEYAPRDAALQTLETVRARFQTEGIPLELHVNSENFFLDEGLLASLERRIGAAGKYLLVEAPYHTPLPSLLDLIFRMKVKGVTPVIAHPERCMEFARKERAVDAVNAGAVLQLDMGALIGRYGKQAQGIARTLLDDGLYGIAATDLHAPTLAEKWVGESLAALEKYGGKGTVERLVSTNPAAILAGEPLRDSP
ncbi:MAG: protein tyrosine phosphatase [Archangium sp.]|nr:protein tyrosine phosphatase [Archangium sp.]